MHRKSAIENPGQTVGNEIFGAYLYLLNHPAHIEPSCSQNFQSMRDVPPNQSIFFRRFRSAGSSPRCATQSWLPAGSRIFGARNGSAAAKGASIFMRSTSRRDAAAALCGTGLVANPFVSALSLPMFNRPAPRWGKIGQPQGILSGLFRVIRGATAPPVAVARVPSTGRSTSVGGRRVCRSGYVRRLAWFPGCALRLKAW